MKTSGVPVFRSDSQNDFKANEAAILQNEQPSISLSTVVASLFAAATSPAALAYVPKNSSVVATLEGNGSAAALFSTLKGSADNDAFECAVTPIAGQTGKSIQWQMGVKPAAMPQALYDAIKALVDPVRPSYTAGALMTSIARVLADAKAAGTYDADKAVVLAGQGGGGLVEVAGVADAGLIPAVGVMAALDDYAEIEWPTVVEPSDPTALPFEGGTVGQ